MPTKVFGQHSSNFKTVAVNWGLTVLHENLNAS